MGPFAGADLYIKIFKQTTAQKDQEHLSVAMLSVPEKISDRTEFILNNSGVNPAYEIAAIIRNLESIGAELIGIACNTAHVPDIYNVLLEELKRGGSQVLLLNMIDEVISYIKEHCLTEKRIGILSTLGVYHSKLYENALIKNGFYAVVPDKEKMKMVHNAIYNDIYGLKARTADIDQKAVVLISRVIDDLCEHKISSVIMGCTEIPLAAEQLKRSYGNLVFIDPTELLAQALIREARK